MKNFFMSEADSSNLEVHQLKAMHPGTELWLRVGNQTAGRGQGVKTWEVAPFKNLTGSFVIYPIKLQAAQQFVLSKIASLAVADFLELFTTDIQIKWPNDIYMGNGKIGGILIENEVTQEWLSSSIIGIGVNLNQTAFGTHLPNPVSLIQSIHTELDIDQASKLLLQCFSTSYNHLMQGNTNQIHQDYLKSLYRYKMFYPYRADKKWFEARIIDIGPFGHLLLEDRQGKKRQFDFGELEFILA